MLIFRVLLFRLESLLVALVLVLSILIIMAGLLMVVLPMVIILRVTLMAALPMAVPLALTAVHLDLMKITPTTTAIIHIHSNQPQTGTGVLPMANSPTKASASPPKHTATASVTWATSATHGAAT